MSAASGSTAPAPDRISLVGVDVARNRERVRQRRLLRVAGALGLVAAFLWVRLLAGDPVGRPHLPHVDPLVVMPLVFFALLSVFLLVSTVGIGRSPHVTYRPEQIEVGLDDVVGIDVVKEEVVRTLQLFLDHQSFAERMGGRARRGILFQGGPGTGKTLTAKAMAAEAGVPFLFASGTSFHSSYQGATQRKVRRYFKALRKIARKEGGAIGFIDEFDGIGGARAGMERSVSTSLAGVAQCGGLDGLPGGARLAGGTTTHAFNGGGDLQMAVNELLVQMQSFDEPTGAARTLGWLVDKVNLFLPPSRHLTRPKVGVPNILLVASTNRADGLDPALLRPGRFDRALTFDLPSKAGRRQLVDHFLKRKAHTPELADAERRDALAAITTGYSPAMIEGLLDEALVSAVRRGADAMDWSDIEHARLVTQIGLGQPVDYTEHEQTLIATHEAGHATVAWLVAPQRRLEVLTIIKRANSLGLLAHGDRDDVFTRSRSELRCLIQIAFGGQVAEELFFGDVSTGPGGDLLYATQVAAQMVGASGMADTLVSFAAVGGSPFGGDNMVGRVLGDQQGRELVEDTLGQQKQLVRGLLGANRHLVEALRDALIERHELVGHEITDVLEAARERHQVASTRPGRVGLQPEVPVAAPASSSDSASVIDLRDVRVERPT
ncbi:MAG: AAA family ATPase [Actinomycetales bacterium]